MVRISLKTRAELQRRTDPNVLKYDNYAKAKLM